MTQEELVEMSREVGRVHDRYLQAQRNLTGESVYLLNLLSQKCGVQKAPQFNFRANSYRKDMAHTIREMKKTATKNAELLDAIETIIGAGRAIS